MPKHRAPEGASTDFEAATAALQDLTGTYTVDVAHTRIGIRARHAMVTTVRGSFTGFAGEASLQPADPAASWVALRIETATIDTGNADRDAHLRSADFLDADNSPKITFRSVRTEPTGGSGFRLHGTLTIRNITQPVIFEARHTATSKDPWGRQRLLYTARTSVNRSDYGIRWNKVLDNGGWLVGERIEIEMDIQALPVVS